MSIWQDSNAGLHDDMDGAALALPSWPPGLVLINADQAEAIRNPPLTLPQAQSAQTDAIETAYQSAIQQPVSYMGTTFQADDASRATLTKSLSAGAVPAGFFWLDIGNAQVPMAFQQLQGLAAAMLAQGQTAFAKKTALKQQIRDATSVAAVRAITWGEA